MDIILIAAMEASRGIGRSEGIPWHLPADLKRFRRLTMGKTLVVGRRTHESILRHSGKPLDGRRTIIVSGRPNYKAEGCTVVASPFRAFEIVLEAGEDELIVAGGASLYRSYLPLATTMQLTLVWETFLCDTFFPRFDWSIWRLATQRLYLPDKRNPYPYTFLTLKRPRFWIDIQALFS